jgi:CheY-like chemotaxis protein
MKRRILLADDSVTIQKVIELTFMDEDYEVRAVSNGDEAMALLPEMAPDFVIADVHMPGANGFEVCRRAKQLRPGTPVLLLVGTFEPFEEAQARAAGADSFLKKPFDSQELLQRVEELIAAKAPVASPPTIPMPVVPAAPAPEPEPFAPAPAFAPEPFAPPEPAPEFSPAAEAAAPLDWATAPEWGAAHPGGAAGSGRHELHGDGRRAGRVRGGADVGQLRAGLRPGRPGG